MFEKDQHNSKKKKEEALIKKEKELEKLRIFNEQIK